MDEENPITWIRESWNESRLDILLPAAAGMAAAQFLTAFFALRSYYGLLLLLVLVGAAFAMCHTFLFLYRLSAGAKSGTLPTLETRDLQLLFGPMLLSVVLYAAIAPNTWLSIFFALVTLPHLLFLAYFVRRYAQVAQDTSARPVTGLLAPAASLGLAVFARAKFLTLRLFKKSPDLIRP